MRNPIKFASILALVATFTGCASIDKIEVGDSREGEPIAVSVGVGMPAALVVIQEVLLGVGPYGIPEGPYNDAGTADSDEYALFYQVFTGEIAGLDWGGHRLRTTVNYTAALSSPKSTEKSKDFWIGAPNGCFDFDDGTLQGWTASPLIVGFETVTLPTCGSDGPDILWDGANSWPISDFAPEHGALYLVLSPNCVPTDSTLISGAPDWQLNLQSPDLAANPHWQGITGVSYRVTSNEVAGFRPSLWVQALLKVRKSDGTETWLMGGPSGAFEPVDTVGWQVIDLPIPGVMPEWTVLEVLVQVLGEPGDWRIDHRFTLDGVCPMTE